MAMEFGCPNVEQLRQFMLGNASAGDAESLGTHLLHCPSCADKVHALDATDSLVQAARDGARSATHPDSALIENLMARLKRIGSPEPGCEAEPNTDHNLLFGVLALQS